MCSFNLRGIYTQQPWICRMFARFIKPFSSHSHQKVLYLPAHIITKGSSCSSNAKFGSIDQDLVPISAIDFDCDLGQITYSPCLSLVCKLN